MAPATATVPAGVANASIEYLKDGVVQVVQGDLKDAELKKLAKGAKLKEVKELKPKAEFKPAGPGTVKLVPTDVVVFHDKKDFTATVPPGVANASIEFLKDGVVKEVKGDLKDATLKAIKKDVKILAVKELQPKADFKPTGSGTVKLVPTDVVVFELADPAGGNKTPQKSSGGGGQKPAVQDTRVFAAGDAVEFQQDGAWVAAVLQAVPENGAASVTVEEGGKPIVKVVRTPELRRQCFLSAELAALPSSKLVALAEQRLPPAEFAELQADPPRLQARLLAQSTFSPDTVLAMAPAELEAVIKSRGLDVGRELVPQVLQSQHYEPGLLQTMSALELQHIANALDAQVMLSAGTAQVGIGFELAADGKTIQRLTGTAVPADWKAGGFQEGAVLRALKTGAPPQQVELRPGLKHTLAQGAVLQVDRPATCLTADTPHVGIELEIDDGQRIRRLTGTAVPADWQAKGVKEGGGVVEIKAGSPLKPLELKGLKHTVVKGDVLQVPTPADKEALVQAILAKQAQAAVADEAFAELEEDLGADHDFERPARDLASFRVSQQVLLSRFRSELEKLRVREEEVEDAEIQLEDLQYMAPLLAQQRAGLEEEIHSLDANTLSCRQDRDDAQLENRRLQQELERTSRAYTELRSKVLRDELSNLAEEQRKLSTHPDDERAILHLAENCLLLEGMLEQLDEELAPLPATKSPKKEQPQRESPPRPQLDHVFRTPKRFQKADSPTRRTFVGLSERVVRSERLMANRRPNRAAEERAGLADLKQASAKAITEEKGYILRAAQNMTATATQLARLQANKTQAVSLRKGQPQCKSAGLLCHPAVLRSGQAEDLARAHSAYKPPPRPKEEDHASPSKPVATLKVGDSVEAWKDDAWYPAEVKVDLGGGHAYTVSVQVIQIGSKVTVVDEGGDLREHNGKKGIVTAKSATAATKGQWMVKLDGSEEVLDFPPTKLKVEAPEPPVELDLARRKLRRKPLKVHAPSELFKMDVTQLRAEAAHRQLNAQGDHAQLWASVVQHTAYPVDAVRALPLQDLQDLCQVRGLPHNAPGDDADAQRRKVLRLAPEKREELASMEPAALKKLATELYEEELRLLVLSRELYSAEALERMRLEELQELAKARKLSYEDNKDETDLVALLLSAQAKQLSAKPVLSRGFDKHTLRVVAAREERQKREAVEQACRLGADKAYEARLRKMRTGEAVSPVKYVAQPTRRQADDQLSQWRKGAEKPPASPTKDKMDDDPQGLRRGAKKDPDIWQGQKEIEVHLQTKVGPKWVPARALSVNAKGLVVVQLEPPFEGIRTLPPLPQHLRPRPPPDGQSPEKLQPPETLAVAPSVEVTPVQGAEPAHATELPAGVWKVYELTLWGNVPLRKAPRLREQVFGALERATGLPGFNLCVLSADATTVDSSEDPPVKAPAMKLRLGVNAVNGKPDFSTLDDQLASGGLQLQNLEFCRTEDRTALEDGKRSLQTHDQRSPKKVPKKVAGTSLGLVNPAPGQCPLCRGGADDLTHVLQDCFVARPAVEKWQAALRSLDLKPSAKVLLAPPEQALLPTLHLVQALHTLRSDAMLRALTALPTSEDAWRGQFEESKVRRSPLSCFVYNCGGISLEGFGSFEWWPSHPFEYAKLVDGCLTRESVGDLVPKDVFTKAVLDILHLRAEDPKAIEDPKAAAMLEEYASVKAKKLLKPAMGGMPASGFFDDSAENGLALNMSGFETTFSEVLKCPGYIGKRPATDTKEKALKQLVQWWQSHLPKLVVPATSRTQEQKVLMEQSDLWEPNKRPWPKTYPWLRALAQYLCWQIINLTYAYRHKEEYNEIAERPQLDREYLAKATVKVIEQEAAEHGTHLFFLQELTTLPRKAVKESKVLGRYQLVGGAENSSTCLLVHEQLKVQQIALPDLDPVKFVAAKVWLGSGPIVVAGFHCPSGGSDTGPERVAKLYHTCRGHGEVLLAGDLNTCPNWDGGKKGSVRSYKENMDYALDVLRQHRSVTQLRASPLGIGYKQHANTVRKQRWIGSTQLPKVGVVDLNPKDFIFVPLSWTAAMVAGDVHYSPNAEEYMTATGPSDHLGVGCKVFPLPTEDRPVHFEGDKIMVGPVTYTLKQLEEMSPSELKKAAEQFQVDLLPLQGQDPHKTRLAVLEKQVYPPELLSSMPLAELQQIAQAKKLPAATSKDAKLIAQDLAKGQTISLEAAAVLEATPLQLKLQILSGPNKDTRRVLKIDKHAPRMRPLNKEEETALEKEQASEKKSAEKAAEKPSEGTRDKVILTADTPHVGIEIEMDADGKTIKQLTGTAVPGDWKAKGVKEGGVVLEIKAGSPLKPLELKRLKHMVVKGDVLQVSIGEEKKSGVQINAPDATDQNTTPPPAVPSYLPDDEVEARQDGTWHPAIIKRELDNRQFEVEVRVKGKSPEKKQFPGYKIRPKGHSLEQLKKMDLKQLEKLATRLGLDPTSFKDDQDKFVSAIMAKEVHAIEHVLQFSKDDLLALAAARGLVGAASTIKDDGKDPLRELKVMILCTEVYSQEALDGMGLKELQALAKARRVTHDPATEGNEQEKTGEDERRLRRALLPKMSKPKSTGQFKPRQSFRDRFAGLTFS